MHGTDCIVLPTPEPRRWWAWIDTQKWGNWVRSRVKSCWWNPTEDLRSSALFAWVRSPLFAQFLEILPSALFFFGFDLFELGLLAGRTTLMSLNRLSLSLGAFLSQVAEGGIYFLVFLSLRNLCSVIQVRVCVFVCVCVIVCSNLRTFVEWIGNGRVLFCISSSFICGRLRLCGCGVIMVGLFLFFARNSCNSFRLLQS